MEIKTISYQYGLKYFQSLKEAFEAADKDIYIYNISFALDNERVQLVRQDDQWVYKSYTSKPLFILDIPSE